MHVLRNGFTAHNWKTLSRRAIAFAQIQFRVNLHSKSIALQGRTRLEVKPFWTIKAVLNNVSLALSCNVDDEFFVDMPETQHHDKLDLTYDLHSRVANMTFDGDVQSVLALSLPYKVDFDIVLKGSGNARIGGVENEKIRIDAESYDISLEDLKSNNISVVSNNGHIHCAKTLKGNIKLESRDGDIATKKIQGHNVHISCETGHAKAGDVYAEDLVMNAAKGIQVKSIHGSSRLQSHGEILVGTAEGDVFVTSRQGNVNLHLADHARDVDVTAECGDIGVSFSSDMNGALNIHANEVDDSDSGLIQNPDQISHDSANYISGNGDGLTIVTVKSPKGMACLRRRSWLEAISAFNEKSKERR